MTLTLPPRVGGEPLAIDLTEKRQIVIIGANGAGKTRFASALGDSLGPRCFRMSAIKALYATDREDTAEGSVDSLYHIAASRINLLRPDLRGEFERLIALLMSEEMVRMIEVKYADSRTPQPGRKQRRDPETRLERMLRRWGEVFPDNRVLVENGRLLFQRDGDDSGSYAHAKLSAGEKAVMYYLGAVSYAPKDAVVMVDSPEMFLHQSSIRALWDKIEQSRPDCTFIYITHDVQFAGTRGDSATVWVKDCDPAAGEWDYDLLTSPEGLADEAYMAILGARKPVLFIEGDGVHSIDAKLYPLIFDEYTVSSLGGCDRVIESTRTFNSLRAFHNLDAFGIVDRDRRDEGEVQYLRSKQIFVPNVAEIENIFMVEDVIRAVARHFRRDEDAAFGRVKHTILRLFAADLNAQALQHTRHRVKKLVEHRIDGRFASIGKLEEHISGLSAAINPRGMYEELCREFHRYLRDGDYASVLRVYNRKSILSESHVARACGLRHDDKDAYIRAILGILKANRAPARTIRNAIREVFSIE